MTISKSALRKLDNLRLEFKRTSKRLKEIQSPAALQFDDAVQLIESVMNDKEVGPERTSEGSFIINSIVDRIRLLCGEYSITFEEIEFAIRKDGSVKLLAKLDLLIPKGTSSDKTKYIWGNLEELEKFYADIKTWCESQFQEFRTKAEPQLVLDPIESTQETKED